MDELDQAVRDGMKNFLAEKLLVRAEAKTITERSAANTARFEEHCARLEQQYVAAGLTKENATARILDVINATELDDLGITVGEA